MSFEQWVLTRTLCVSSCVSPLTELLPLLVPIPRSLRSFASSSLYMAKLMLSLRPLLPRSSIISEKVLFRRRWRSCSSNSSFFTSTTRSIICSCRFLRLLFQLSKFCEYDVFFLLFVTKNLNCHTRASEQDLTDCQSSGSSRTSCLIFFTSCTFWSCSCAVRYSEHGPTLTNCKGLVACLGGVFKVVFNFGGSCVSCYRNKLLPVYPSFLQKVVCTLNF